MAWRAFCAALAAASFLAACSEPKTANSGAPGASEGPRVRGLSWVAKQSGMVPEWIDVANQAGGGTVEYSAKSVLLDTVTGESEGWVQVTHRTPQTEAIDLPTEVRTITYQRERVLLRFQCKAKKVAVVERRYVSGTEIVEAYKTPPRPEDFRPFQTKSLPGVVYDEMCNAV